MADLDQPPYDLRLETEANLAGRRRLEATTDGKIARAAICVRSVGAI